MKNILRTSCAVLATVTVGVAVLSSCRKDVFEEQKYEELVAAIYPIDGIDVRHSWSLLQSKVIIVNATVPDDDVTLVQVLNGNPYDGSGTAEVMGQQSAVWSQRVGVTYNLPVGLDQLYAAVVTSSGKYYVKPFTPEDEELNFSRGNVISEGTFAVPHSQTYTYIYEGTFPMPDDFDYNDVVMRLSMDAPSDTVLKVRVTLVAVGLQQQLGAALRLTNVPYEQVTAVTVDEGDAFDSGYPLMRQMLPKGDTYVRGNDGDAVIYLFEDAHWALTHTTDNLGAIRHPYYNTKTTPQANVSATVPTKTRTYTVHLKEGTRARRLQLANMDPFVIDNFNGSYYEIHIHRYKFAEVLWEYTAGSADTYNDNMAWALLIPSATFRYPLEGVALGTYRDGQIAGVYSKYQHSFGEWGSNSQTATDWWRYPNYGYYPE